MFRLRNPIRWHNRLMDGLTVGMNASVVFTGLAVAFNPMVAGLGLAIAAIGTLSLFMRDELFNVEHPTSPRGKALCNAFSARAHIRPPTYLEPALENGLGSNNLEKISVDESFAVKATTPELASILGHEIGHTQYGQLPGYLNKLLTITAVIGCITTPLATPWLGLAGTGLSLGILVVTSGASFLLAQIQQRQEEYACDRVSVTYSGQRAIGHLLKNRNQYGCEDSWNRKSQNRCRPNSIAEQIINLIDSHPPAHRRISAVYDFAARLGPDHTEKTERELIEKFDHLSRLKHEPEPKPVQVAYNFS
jgi:Zn-dependent protease with chaperone function